MDSCANSDLTCDSKRDTDKEIFEKFRSEILILVASLTRFQIRLLKHQPSQLTKPLATLVKPDSLYFNRINNVSGML